MGDESGIKFNAKRGDLRGERRRGRVVVRGILHLIKEHKTHVGRGPEVFAKVFGGDHEFQKTGV
jgi:hypothetical protein